MVPPMRVHIPGKPIPYPRSGGSGARRYTPGPFRDWIELAAKAIAETEGVELGISTPVAVEVVVSLSGVHVDLEILGRRGGDSTSTSLWIDLANSAPFERPKGLRGDLDNYAKAVLDALQWRDENPIAPPGWIIDDRQVVVLVAWFSE